MRPRLDCFAGRIVIAPGMPWILPCSSDNLVIVWQIIRFHGRKMSDGICDCFLPLRPFRPLPSRRHIIAKSNDENTLTVLRHFIVYSVYKFILNIVFQSVVCLEINFPKFCQMFPPRPSSRHNAIWECQP